MNNPYCTIDSIVSAYLVESEQSDTRRYKIWQIAFRGSEQLGLDFFYRIKSVKLPRNANFTVTLPSDYINYTKVGVLNGRGELMPLKYNNKLTTYADLLPDRIEKTQDNNLFNFYCLQYPLWYNYWDGNGFINLYGLSGETVIGTFKIDPSNNIILLGENFGYEYIVLEYVASPQYNGSYNVPIQFKEAMIAYIAWKDISNTVTTSHFNLGDKDRRRREFFNERRLAIARYRPTYLEEAYSASVESQRLSVKF